MSAWTEQDAKALWCPMTRVGDVNLGGVANRPDCGTNCLASGCMMWRWLDAAEERSNSHYRDQELQAAGWRSTRKPEGNTKIFTLANRRGYCGIAGKP